MSGNGDNMPSTEFITLENSIKLPNKEFANVVMSFLEKNQVLSDADLELLTSQKYCREFFSSDYAMLRQITGDKDINEQIRDNTNRNRYYKQIYTINGASYVMTSQLYGFSNNPTHSDNRTPFWKWVINKITVNDWWPSLSEYDPGISEEDWLLLLNNPSVMTNSRRRLLAMFYEAGGTSTCKQLGIKYEEDPSSLSGICTQLAIKVQEVTRCPVFDGDNGVKNYWPILFKGKKAAPSDEGLRLWKLRPELYDALTEYDIMRFLKEEPEVPAVTTEETLNIIESYIASKGFVFTKEMIDNVYLSLKSKPFVILAGISGTGKSKMAQLFAEAIGAKYKMISVRPDWSDSTDLLGFVNLDGKFNPGLLTEILQKANQNPDTPYIICLDEMNLARVEYYFSDFLSVIETMGDKDGEYRSDQILKDADFKSDEEAKEKYGDVHISANVYIIGTVNMDETTFPFSKKVLDRANTIEFSEIELGIPAGDDASVEKIKVGSGFLQKEFVDFRATYTADDGKYRADIEEMIKMLDKINGCLEDIGAQVAYRVRDEIAYYLATARKYDLMKYEDVIDHAVMQKILPRIQGSSNHVKNALLGIAGELLDDKNLASSDSTFADIRGRIEKSKYKKSLGKIAFMLRRYEIDGYTSYWI